MSLSNGFNGTIQNPAQSAPVRTKRLPPFSIRLSEAERARLIKLAAGAPLSTFVKDRVFAGAGPDKRQAGITVRDREALAQTLAMLGRSRLTSNLNQLARLANVGALPMTPETEAELAAALHDVRAMRRMLMVALGLKPGATP